MYCMNVLYDDVFTKILEFYYKNIIIIVKIKIDFYKLIFLINYKGFFSGFKR
jgi:hypothetical protein